MKASALTRVIGITLLLVALVGVVPIAFFAIVYGSYFYQALPSPSLGVIMVGPVYDLFLLIFLFFFVASLIRLIRWWRQGLEARTKWSFVVLAALPYLFFAGTTLITKIDSAFAVPSDEKTRSIVAYSVFSALFLAIIILALVGYLRAKSKQKAATREMQ